MPKKEYLIIADYTCEPPISLQELREICHISTDFIHNLVEYEIIYLESDISDDMLFDLQQYSDIALFLLRLSIGVIFIVHGLPKLKGAKAMAPMMGMPVAAVLFLGFIEAICGLELILGVYRVYIKDA